MRGDEYKQDAGKTQWSLFPMEAAEWIVRVLMFGAKKYSPNGWRTNPPADAFERSYDALQRHLNAHRRGELLDNESDLPHLAHAGCDMIFMIWYSLCNPADGHEEQERRK